jgi:cytoskeletal protein CcmA (bactofilin family)
MEAKTVHLGASVFIKGHVTAGEDLTIAGRVEGTIDLNDRVLTVVQTAQIAADISAGTVRVAGTIAGNIIAADTIEIGQTGSVEGDITAVRVAISDGALFRGHVDVQRSKAAAPASGPTAFPVAV